MDALSRLAKLARKYRNPAALAASLAQEIAPRSNVARGARVAASLMDTVARARIVVDPPDSKTSPRDARQQPPPPAESVPDDARSAWVDANGRVIRYL